MSPRERRRQDFWDWCIAALFVAVLILNSLGVFGE